MGGTLRPENTPGGGLTMTLALPAVETDADADPQQLADPAILDRLDSYQPHQARAGQPDKGHEVTA
jgi:hypothetical protein